MVKGGMRMDRNMMNSNCGRSVGDCYKRIGGQGGVEEVTGTGREGMRMDRNMMNSNCCRSTR